MRSLTRFTFGISVLAFACGGNTADDTLAHGVPDGSTAGAAGAPSGGTTSAGTAGFTALGAGATIAAGAPAMMQAGATTVAGAGGAPTFVAGAGGAPTTMSAGSQPTSNAGSGGAVPAIHNGGACTPGGGLVTLVSTIGSFATNGDVMVVTDAAFEHAIRTVGLDGSTAALATLEEPTLLGVTSDAAYLTAIDPAQNSDSSASAPSIFRVPFDGSPAVALEGIFSDSNAMAAGDGATLYIGSGADVYAVEPTDTAVAMMPVFSVGDSIRGIAFDQSYVYVAIYLEDDTVGQIWRAPKDHSAPAALFLSGLDFPVGLHADAAALYWSNDSATIKGAGDLFAATFDGAAPTQLSPGPSDVFALGPTALYALSDHLAIVPKDGSAVTNRAVAVERPANAVFVGQTLLWLQNGTYDNGSHPAPSLVAYCP